MVMPSRLTRRPINSNRFTIHPWDCLGYASNPLQVFNMHILLELEVFLRLKINV